MLWEEIRGAFMIMSSHNVHKGTHENLKVNCHGPNLNQVNGDSNLRIFSVNTHHMSCVLNIVVLCYFSFLW